MKNFNLKVFLSVFLFNLFTPARANEVLTYTDLIPRAEAYQQRLRVEGMGYMVGGSIALATSFALGVQSKQVIPKVGYTVMQLMSTASIFHGARQYYIGDDLLQEARRLTLLSKSLREDSKMTVAERKLFMDKFTRILLSEYAERRAREKIYRGVAEVITSATSFGTYVFAEDKSISNNIPTLLIGTVSAIAGIADWLTAYDDSLYEALPSPDEPSFSLKMNGMGVALQF